MNYNLNQTIELKKNFWQFTDEARIGIARKLIDDNIELQSTITQLQSDVKCRDGMLAQIASETGNFIKQQAELIKRLREDAERLATRYEYFDSRVHRSSSYCRYCGHLIQIKSHADNCPITLHTQLMNELGEK
jgi:rubrerythrin